MKQRFIRLFACAAWVLAAVSTPRAAEDFSNGLLDRDAVHEAARALTREVYPNSDDVLVAEHIRDEYRADGTSISWDDEYIKVLTEKGKRARRSFSLHYRLPYGTAEFKRLEVIKPDGKIESVDVAKMSRVMVDRSQMAANIYNPNSKVLEITVPSLDVGDVVHVISFRDEVKTLVPNTWSEYQVFEYTTPIKSLVYEVIGPKSLPLRNIRLRDEVPGTVSYTKRERDDRVLHRWEVKDVPRIFKEPKMPEYYTVVQRLLISTIPDWQEISKWYWDLSAPRLEAVTDDMRAKVSELTAGLETRSRKIEAIFRFVSQEIRYMGITPEKEAPGYEPHDVKLTFANRYGVCRDKAALLAAMLRLSDIPAYPVLIHSGPKKDEEVPQPYFNHAITAVSDGKGGYTLMDSTDENTKELFPAYLCNDSYLVADPEGEGLRTSPIIPATNNLMRVESNGRIDASGALQMQSTLRFDGINDNVYRGYFSNIKPEERRRYFEGVLKRRIPGARLSRFEIEPADMQDTSKPLSVELTYTAADYLIGGDSYSMVAPPWLGTSVGFANFVLRDTGLEKRKYPLRTEVACGVTESFAIQLGESVGKPALVPDYQPVKTNTVTFERSLSVEDGTLKGSGTFLLTTVEFNPEEYLALKRVLRDIEYDRRKRPVFENPREETRKNDIRVLSDEVTIHVEDPHTWSSTQRVRKQILTYAGKKKNSELKLNYNPAWETVRLGAVRVTGANGKVRDIAPEEINVMDAKWVGSAPRYPAAKTKVVSLPAVEVGSVIEYEVRYENRGFPFLSLVHSFRGFDPIDNSVLEIDVPKSMTLNVLDLTGGAVAFTQEGNDRLVYRWSATGQDGVPREDSLPPWWSFNPSVFVSTGTWPTYLAAVRQALAPLTTGQSKTEALARKIVSGIDGTKERITAVRDYVVKNIRLAGPPFTALPLSALTAADRTLADGYGNGADRAIVMQTMLAAVGVDSQLVLSSSTGSRVESLDRPFLSCPQRGLFDGLLVSVAFNDAHVYLNDTDQYARLGVTTHDERPGMTLNGEVITVAADEAYRNRGCVEYTVDLSASGDAVIEYRKLYSGTAHAAFHRRFAELPPEERRRYFQKLLSALSQAAVAVGELETATDVHPGEERFTATVPRYAVRSGKFLYLTIPEGVRNVLPLRSDHRTGPLYRPAPVRASSRCTVILPKGTDTVELVPSDLAWQGPDALGTLRLHTTQSKRDDGRRVVVVEREVDFHSAVVAAEHYSSLLDLNRRAEHPATRTLMVRLRE